MKIFKLILLISALFSLQFCSRDNNEEISSVTLSSREKNDLLFSFEEEKMARDTYIFLNNKWGIAQFANIQNSEQSHMNTVENLLKKYNIPYQILPQGQFSDAELQVAHRVSERDRHRTLRHPHWRQQPHHWPPHGRCIE